MHRAWTPLNPAVTDENIEAQGVKWFLRRPHPSDGGMTGAQGSFLLTQESIPSCAFLKWIGGGKPKCLWESGRWQKHGQSKREFEVQHGGLGTGTNCRVHSPSEVAASPWPSAATWECRPSTVIHGSCDSLREVRNQIFMWNLSVIKCWFDFFF